MPGIAKEIKTKKIMLKNIQTVKTKKYLKERKYRAKKNSSKAIKKRNREERRKILQRGKNNRQHGKEGEQTTKGKENNE